MDDPSKNSGSQTNCDPAGNPPTTPHNNGNLATQPSPCCDCSRHSTCCLTKDTLRSRACSCKQAGRPCTSCTCFRQCRNKEDGREAPAPAPKRACSQPSILDALVRGEVPKNLPATQEVPDGPPTGEATGDTSECTTTDEEDTSSIRDEDLHSWADDRKGSGGETDSGTICPASEWDEDEDEDEETREEGKPIAETQGIDNRPTAAQTEGTPTAETHGIDGRPTAAQTERGETSQPANGGEAVRRDDTSTPSGGEGASGDGPHLDSGAENPPRSDEDQGGGPVEMELAGDPESLTNDQAGTATTNEQLPNPADGAQAPPPQTETAPLQRWSLGLICRTARQRRQISA